MRYSSLISQPIPQSEPLDSRQVANNAGGFVYQIDNWARLQRFLVIGSDSSTYYQKAVTLTRENAKCVTACFDENPVKAIDIIVTTSHEGRAPKNDPAIFALAIGATHKEPKVRQLALGALPAVCRIATHLFQFVQAYKALGGGWGRAPKRAVAKWYNDKSVDDVAFQMIKYRDREGWTHKDMMRVAHPDAKALDRRALYQWVRTTKIDNPKKLPTIVHAFEQSMDPKTSKKDRLEIVKAVNLPWEALPTECNSDPDYWAAQLPSMGLTALMRNLGNMSRIGLIKPLSTAEKLISERLSDENVIRKSRLHPFNILVALKTYESGHGFRGTNSWEVSQPVVSALDSAFYKAFKNVEPTGKRFLIGLDVSGSMSSKLMNSNVSCCEATAALSLVTASTEKQVYINGFCHQFVDLGIRNGMTLSQATSLAYRSNFGGTDCALPMLTALEKKLEVDVFIVLTDNETWAGRVHPSQALKDYRRKMGINAKLIVVGMTSTGFSIADPSDPNMLDVVGMDTAVPSIIAEFARS